MKIYTDKQIDGVLAEINFLGKQVEKEDLSQAIHRILAIILNGEKVNIVVKEVEK